MPWREAPTEAAHLGNVTLDSVTEENGGYKIGTVTLPDYSSTEEGMTIDIAGASITGLTLPAEGSTDPLASLDDVRKGQLASVSVKQGDKQLFSLNNLHVEMTPPTDGEPMEFTGAAEKFTADLASAEDPKATEVIEALGYRRSTEISRWLVPGSRATAAWTCRNTTSRSRMPARSA